MRYAICFLMAAVLLFSVPATAEEKVTSQISVSGTGEIYIPADTAIVSLGVTAADRDVLAAQANVNTAIAAIREALTASGAAKEDINTGTLNIYATYDYSGAEEQLTGYRASSTLAIRVRDMAAVGTVIDTAFAAGANTLDGISFSAEDTSGAEKEALKAAVADARAKAEVLAEASGLTLMGIRTLSESGTYSMDSGLNNFRAAKAESPASAQTIVQAAKLCVTGSVTIVFDAE